MILKRITYYGKECVVVCDGNCNKAWGWNSRPKAILSDDEDDILYVADGDLGSAPIDPGTYEGGDAKPGPTKLNKWCVRECERSEIVEDLENFKLTDFSKPVLNITKEQK